MFKLGILLSLSVALANVACAQKEPLKATGHSGYQKLLLTPELRAQIGERLSDTSVPGYSLVFVDVNGHVEYGNWGVRTEEGDPMTSDTQFIVASVSKQFTATALGLVIDDYAHGRNVTPLPGGLQELRWDTKLKDILPEDWALMDPWASEKANLHDVLSHVSGLPRHDFAYRINDTPLDRVRSLRFLRPAYELRERWQYNNHMYILASHLVSVLSNSTFSSFLRDRIFAPLNMTSSTIDPNEASHRVTHVWADTSPVNRRVPELFTPSEASLITGAGAIISSAEDMAKWLSVLLKEQNEETNKTEAIPKSVIREVTRPRSLTGGFLGEVPGFQDSERETYGKGWFQRSYRGHRHIEHGGNAIGYTTLLSLYPDKGFGIVQLANTAAKNAVNLNISLLIADAALGLGPLQPPDRAGSLDSLSFNMLKQTPSGFSKLSLYPSNLTDNSLEWPLETFARTYTDPGYGTLTLCTSKSTSAYCRRVLSVYSSLSPDGTVDSSHLYAEWPSVFVSHMRFVPLSADNRAATVTNGEIVAHFGLQITKIYPEGYGANRTAFELEEGPVGARADFVLDDNSEVVGMGWTGLFGEEVENARKPGSIEDTAQVWFVVIPQ